MKVYTVFEIEGRKYPQNLVIKRLRDTTKRRLAKRGYDHLFDIECRTKREALKKARHKYRIESAVRHKK